MVVLKRTRSDTEAFPKEDVELAGSTGNIYTVRVPRCKVFILAVLRDLYTQAIWVHVSRFLQHTGYVMAQVRRNADSHPQHHALDQKDMLLSVI